MGLTTDPRFNSKVASNQNTPPEGILATDMTPPPKVSAAWIEQQKRPTFKRDLYGIDLCDCASRALMRSNGGVPPDELWVSDLLIPEIEADMILIYGTLFNGCNIPFLYSKRVIKVIRIRVDDSLPKNTVAYSLP